jgi:predicted dinucleotide-binding enzyme
MKIAVLGTGMVGEAIATKLVQLGHHVCMGSRTKGNEKAVAWTTTAGTGASEGNFTDAVAGAEIVFVCLKGEITLDVLRSIGPAAFANKIVVDVSNPLDFSRGMPPSLLICNTNSLGEEVQKALPEARVVKTLNIVNCEVMVDPTKTGGPVTMLMCGNDATAKQTVAELLRTIGWLEIIDLGGIAAARGTEMMMPVWLSLWGVLGTAHFGFKLVHR